MGRYKICENFHIVTIQWLACLYISVAVGYSSVVGRQTRHTRQLVTSVVVNLTSDNLPCSKLGFRLIDMIA